MTDEQTYFGCIEIEDAERPMFVHFNPPLGVLPGEAIYEARDRQPRVAVAVLPEPLVPPGPVAPPAPTQGMSQDLLKFLAPLVWQHVARYGFAPVPYNPSTWRGSLP